MTDWHDELLSAYLDGELTPAERADVERRLAGDPAARRLLDELRSLSESLKGLPRESVGKDLRQQVLQSAAQREIAEREPTIDLRPSPASEPLGRAFARRFLNRRSLSWTVLAVAIALLITFNERQQGLGPQQGDADREVARVTAPSERRQRKPGPAPTMQATDHGAVKQEVEEALAVKAAPAKVTADKLPAPSDKPMDRSNAVQLFAAGEERAVQPAAPALPKSSKPGERPLVVRCDIDAAAARDGAFEQLLDAHGIVWNSEDGDAVAAKGKAPEAPASKMLVQQKRISAEATPAQLTSLLAGLAAQPKAFLAVSVRGDGDAFGRSLGELAGKGDKSVDRKLADGVGASALRAKMSTGAAVRSENLPATRAPAEAAAREFEFRQMTQVGGPAPQRKAGDLPVSVKQGVGSEALSAPPALADLASGEKRPDQTVSVGLASASRRVVFELRLVESPKPAASEPPAVRPTADR